MARARLTASAARARFESLTQDSARARATADGLRLPHLVTCGGPARDSSEPIERPTPEMVYLEEEIRTERGFEQIVGSHANVLQLDPGQQTSKGGEKEAPLTLADMQREQILEAQDAADEESNAAASALPVPKSGAKRLRMDHRKPTVTDGPFAETHELLGG